jgi:hypothetical protein
MDRKKFLLKNLKKISLLRNGSKLERIIDFKEIIKGKG